MGGTAALVSPGRYTVSISKIVRGEWIDIMQSESFEVKPLFPKNSSPSDKNDLKAFQQQVYALGQSIEASRKQLNQSIEKVKNIQQSILAHSKRQKSRL